MASAPAATSRNHPSREAHQPFDASHLSDAHLFVKNLRFLDLDLLSDWPGITASTFRATKDAHSGQKNRIRSAEWALYRLFEIWDPKETRIKLRLYFPALEPIQSLKLRATLLQWLAQLKTAGILGRDCALRKSLFDECKGEKFEEILFCLSTVVLQKAVAETNKPASVVQNLALAKTPSPEHDEKIKVLELAHKSSITSKLAQRKIYSSRIQGLADDIRNRTQNLESKASLLDAEVQRHESALNAAGIDAPSLKKQLRNDCIGDATWLSLILSGDSDQGRDGLIERQFADIWTQTKQGDELTLEQCPKSLLSDLDDRINAQQTRLNEWRNFQTLVSKRNEAFIVAKSPTKSPYKSPSKTKTSTPMRNTPNRGVASSAVKRSRPIKTGMQSSSSYARGGLEPTTPKTQPEPLTPSYLELQTKMEPSSIDPKSNEPGSTTAKRSCRSQSPHKSGLPIRPHYRSRSDISSPISPSTHGDSIFPKDEIRREVLHSNSDDSDINIPPAATDAPFRNTPHLTGDMARLSELHHSPKSQTLSERTLQTLQQCQTSGSSASQRRPYQSHSQSKSESTPHYLKESPMGASILGPISLPTPESSRPGTAKSISTALGTPTAAGLSEADFRFPPSSPLGAQRPLTPSRQSPTRSTSPPKKLSDSPARPFIPESVQTSGDRASPNVSENPARTGAQTPPELLFAEDADCASVFKSRSKLRQSPPASPLGSASWN